MQRNETVRRGVPLPLVLSIRLQPSSHKRREADYEWHLEHPSARHGEKPIDTVSYLLVPKPGEKQRVHDEDEDEPGADPEDQPEADEDTDLKTDFLMEFARDLLAQSKGVRRRELVTASKAYLDKVRATEDKKLSAALEKLGVDWSAGPAAGAMPSCSCRCSRSRPRPRARTAASRRGR